MHLVAAFILGLVLVAQTTVALASSAVRCLYVSSYHAGYEWNDDIERGLESALQNRCVIKKFYMDGKRHLDEVFAKTKALEAKRLVDSWKPDIIIAADDNASKYLIMPYFKNVAVPVVFCGINWTADAYGYPYHNATGMIEVGPLEPLHAEVLAVVKRARRGVFLSANEITQNKEFLMVQKFYQRRGITVTHKVVSSMTAWQGLTRQRKTAPTF